MKDKPETPKVTLKKLTLENFKNFQKAELELGPFTVLVGANATGKSNIREAFRFLHGIGRGYTLPEIIGEKHRAGERVWQGIRGGINEISYSGQDRFSIQIDFDFQENQQIFESRYCIDIAIEQMVGATIINETLGYISHLPLYEWSNPNFWHDLAPLQKPGVVLLADGMLQQKNLSQMNESEIQKSTHFAKYFVAALQSMRFPEFKLDLMRQASFPGQTVLRDGGDNLSSVLHTIYQNPQQKEILLFWLRELTPMDVTDLDFFMDEVGQVRVRFVERDGRKISVFSASDGTLRFLGVLAALLSPEPAQFYFFEELESGVHPARQYLLLQLIQEKTNQLGIQVVATTHSPAILDFAKQDILEYSSLVYRLENEPSAHIKRIFDIPDARRLAEEQGLGTLLASRWFENVMFLLSDGEEAETTEEVAA